MNSFGAKAMITSLTGPNGRLQLTRNGQVPCIKFERFHFPRSLSVAMTLSFLRGICKLSQLER